MSKIANDGLTRMLYSSTHMAAVGVKGLIYEKPYVRVDSTGTETAWTTCCTTSAWQNTASCELNLTVPLLVSEGRWNFVYHKHTSIQVYRRFH